MRCEETLVVDRSANLKERRAEVKAEVRASLVRLLEESGASKSALADAVGVSKAAVSNWTNGACSVDIGCVPDICDFFGITADELFGKTSSPGASAEEERLLCVYRKLPETLRKCLHETSLAMLVASRARRSGD